MTFRETLRHNRHVEPFAFVIAVKMAMAEIGIKAEFILYNREGDENEPRQMQGLWGRN
jgi:hypothetical protein